MPFNVEDFKAKFPGGGARPTQFEVTFNPPGVASPAEIIRFMVKAASLPPSIVEKAEVFYFGRAIPLSGDRVFPDWRVTVINDESFDIRAMIEAWSNGINALQYNLQTLAVTPSGTITEPAYKQDVQVTQYSKRGDIIRKYDLRGAWPTEIGEIRLDWEDRNRIEVFDVTFAYDYWLPFVIGSQTAKQLFNPTSAGDVKSNS